MAEAASIKAAPPFGSSLPAGPAADATESNVSLARPEPLYECAADGALA
jgi:hypothetical protein